MLLLAKATYTNKSTGIFHLGILILIDNLQENYSFPFVYWELCVWVGVWASGADILKNFSYQKLNHQRTMRMIFSGITNLRRIQWWEFWFFRNLNCWRGSQRNFAGSSEFSCYLSINELLEKLCFWKWAFYLPHSFTIRKKSASSVIPNFYEFRDTF